MKKYILLLCFVSIVICCVMAQDIIITTDEQKIASQILEISEEYVKYTDLAHQDSIVTTLPVKNISTIIFASGQVKNFGYKTQLTQIIGADTIYLYRKGSMYIYDGVQMKGKDYAAFLKENCIEAYKQYNQGQSMIIAGWCLLGTGVALASMIPLVSAVSYDRGIFASLGLASCAAAISSIPILHIGYYKKHSSTTMFNDAQIAVNLTASQNGIGLALKF